MKSRILNLIIPPLAGTLTVLALSRLEELLIYDQVDMQIDSKINPEGKLTLLVGLVVFAIGTLIQAFIAMPIWRFLKEKEQNFTTRTTGVFGIITLVGAMSVAFAFRIEGEGIWSFLVSCTIAFVFLAGYWAANLLVLYKLDK